MEVKTINIGVGEGKILPTRAFGYCPVWCGGWNHNAWWDFPQQNAFRMKYSDGNLRMAKGWMANKKNQGFSLTMNRMNNSIINHTLHSSST